MMSGSSINVAIVGAGLAGLTLAHQLRDVAEVTLFDKSRGVGGRMATRRAPPYQFDHGAQYFTVRTPEFQAFIQPYLDEGILQPWAARFVEIDGTHCQNARQWSPDHPHYVGTPAMNAFGKALAKDCHVVLSCQISDCLPISPGLWQLNTADGTSYGPFNWVIFTAPVQQSAALMPACFCAFDILRSMRMVGCFSLMAGFEQPLDLNFDAALVKGSDLSWISRNQSKPGRHQPESLTIFSRNEWAEAHHDWPVERVQRHLWQVASELLSLGTRQPDHLACHHWRYANSAKQILPVLLDVKNHLAACGDWCEQGRVESAFTSANQLAQALKLSWLSECNERSS